MATPVDQPSESRFGPADPRRSTERLEDLHRISEQVGNINRQLNDTTVSNDLIRVLQERRAPENRLGRREDLVPVQFDPVPHPRGDIALVARGELLIRAEALPEDRARSLTENYGLQVQPVEGLDNRLIRLLAPDLRGSQLVELANSLHKDDTDVSVNYVAPMGVVLKVGLGGPEHSVAKQRPTRPAPGRGEPVRVAVIDTGIPRQERGDGWLTGLVRADNIDPLDVLPAPDGWLDLGAGHGTFVTGIIQQVAPDADISVYRALDSDGIGDKVLVASEMVRAVRDGAQILNLSFGLETLDDHPPVAFEVALEIINEITEETGREVLVVAAAGNFGRTRPSWPAAFHDVVAVAGLAQDLTPSDWSSRGPWVDCSTMAEGIWSTYVPGQESPLVDPEPEEFVQDDWALWTGTSFAAPQVVGAVAKIIQEKDCTPRQALQKLLTGRPEIPGYGRALRILPAT
ncbi:MAG: S8 family peptidase [Pseudonocardiaceae bacterium]